MLKSTTKINAYFLAPIFHLLAILLYGIPYCSSFSVSARQDIGFFHVVHSSHTMVSTLALFQWIILVALPCYLVLRRWDVWIMRYVQLIILKYGAKRTRLQVSIPEALVFLSYLGANVLVMLPWFRKEPLQHVSVNLAMVNMLPLFLPGSINPIANLLHIPGQMFRLVVFYAATICFGQLLIHGARDPFKNMVCQSGFVALCCAGVSVLLHFLTAFLCRRNISNVILSLLAPMDRILRLALLASITWHLQAQSLPFASFAFATTALSAVLWLASYAIVLWRYFHHGRGAVMLPSDDGKSLDIRLRRPIAARPSYFFVGLQSQPHASHAVPMVWWNAGVITTRRFFVPVELPLKAVRTQRTRGRVDGPYAEELYLGKYETVIFVAEGSAISRVLPHLLYMAARMSRDKSSKKVTDWSNVSRLFNDKTRKIDLYWKMDTTEQILEVNQYFQELNEKNADAGVQAWVHYPKGIPTVTHLPNSTHWIAVEGDFQERVSGAIRAQSQRTPGRAITIC